MLNLAILIRRNAGVIAVAIIAALIVAVIAGVALTPARGATPLGDPNAVVVEPTIAPPDSLPPPWRVPPPFPYRPPSASIHPAASWRSTPQPAVPTQASRRASMPPSPAPLDAT
jgi:hypothetical protein